MDAHGADAAARPAPAPAGPPKGTAAAAAKAWHAIGFKDLTASLQQRSSEILAAQEQSAEARKELIEQTKAFRRLTSEEKAAAIPALVKAYQSEIDRFTKRCNASEGAALALYTALVDAPDPAPLLAVAAQTPSAGAITESPQIAQLQAENDRLRTQAESAGRLQATLSRYQEKMDEYIAEKVAEKESEWRSASAETVESYRDRERSLEKQLAALQTQLHDAQARLEDAQGRLVRDSVAQERGMASRIQQLDMLVGEQQRASVRLAQLESENSALRQQLDASQASRELESARKHALEQDAEIQTLLVRVDALTQAGVQHEAALQRERSDREQAVAERQAALEKAESQMQAWSDYPAVRSELERLRTLVVGDSRGGAASDQNVTLERLLSEKSRRLEAKVAELNGQLGEAAAARTEAEQRVAALAAELEEQRSLAKRLDEEALVLASHAQPLGASASTAAPAPTTDEFMSELFTSLTTKPSERPPAATPASVESAGRSATSLVDVLTRQRDRYREKVAALEAQAKDGAARTTSLAEELESSKRDNTQLFEKIRYLESVVHFGDPSRLPSSPSALAGSSDSFAVPVVDAPPLGRRGSALRLGPPGPVGGTGRDAYQQVESRYRPLYEAQLDPFQSFQKREALQRLKSLTVAEKAALSVARLMFSNHYSRLFFIYYSVGLHLLIMVVLYYSVH